jgi:hypothetical protein
MLVPVSLLGWSKEYFASQGRSIEQNVLTTGALNFTKEAGVFFRQLMF